MPEWVNDVFQYLVGIQLHPMVTAVVFIIMAVGKQRWEEPYVIMAKQAMADAAKSTPENSAAIMKVKLDLEMKANRISNYVMLLGLIISVVGEFALYWPKSSQAKMICIFMSFAQVGTAWITYFYVDKWGLMDHFGHLIQKKIDEKAGTPTGP